MPPLRGAASLPLRRAGSAALLLPLVIRVGLHSRRWRPPVPKAAWPGAVRNATAFGASCVQPGGFDPPIPNQHEDCLFLNVYGPPLAPPSYSVARLAPVLLYLHGGSYLQGSAAEQRLNATAAVGLLHARGEPMLIVTANYRLGVMGFLGGAELRACSR